MTTVTDDKLTRWHNLQKQLEPYKKLQEQEMALRKEIIAEMFPNALEGTNVLQLGNGWRLRATIKLDRKVEVEKLAATKEELIKRGVNPDRLLRYKPELVVKEYRTLTEEQQKVMDYAITTKPASPQLELVAPTEEEH